MPIWVTGSEALTMPVSTATVASAMIPCPHIVLNPALCMNSTPRSAPGETGSVTKHPYMSAWPLGSSINSRRTSSR